MMLKNNSKPINVKIAKGIFLVVVVFHKDAHTQIQSPFQNFLSAECMRVCQNSNITSFIYSSRYNNINNSKEE